MADLTATGTGAAVSFLPTASVGPGAARLMLGGGATLAIGGYFSTSSPPAPPFYVDAWLGFDVVRGGVAVLLTKTDVTVGVSGISSRGFNLRPSGAFQSWSAGPTIARDDGSSTLVSSEIKSGFFAANVGLGTNNDSATAIRWRLYDEALGASSPRNLTLTGFRNTVLGALVAVQRVPNGAEFEVYDFGVPAASPGGFATQMLRGGAVDDTLRLSFDPARYNPDCRFFALVYFEPAL